MYAMPDTGTADKGGLESLDSCRGKKEKLVSWLSRSIFSAEQLSNVILRRNFKFALI